LFAFNWSSRIREETKRDRGNIWRDNE
jgi:hypothetical protein